MDSLERQMVNMITAEPEISPFKKKIKKSRIISPFQKPGAYITHNAM